MAAGRGANISVLYEAQSDGAMLSRRAVDALESLSSAMTIERFRVTAIPVFAIVTDDVCVSHATGQHVRLLDLATLSAAP